MPPERENDVHMEVFNLIPIEEIRLGMLLIRFWWDVLCLEIRQKSFAYGVVTVEMSPIL